MIEVGKHAYRSILFYEVVDYHVSKESVNSCICLVRRARTLVMLPDWEWVGFSEATPTDTLLPPAPGM